MRSRKSAPSASASKVRDHWLVGATLVTQDDERRILRQNLCISGSGATAGRIIAITSRRPPAGARTHDLTGKIVLPGLVQTHVHLCQTLFRNQADDLELLDWLRERIWKLEAAHSRESLYLSARIGIQELLSTGTTCLLDMGTVRHTDAIFEAVRDTGIRANVGKCLMDRTETCPPNLRERTDAAFDEAVALIERWHGTEGDRIRASLAPRFVISCSEKLLQKVAEHSRAHGTLVHTHASENQREVELVRELVGSDNIEYLARIGLTSPRLVLAHCIWVSRREQKILRDSGTHVAHCPGSNLKLASGIAPIAEYLADGVSVSLGTDGAACNNHLNQLAEMRLAALLQKPRAGATALNAQTTLDLATRNGARALGWQDDIGSLEVGKRADLLVLDLERASSFGEIPDAPIKRRGLPARIVYSTEATAIEQTWVQGRMVFSRGASGTMAEKALIARAERALKSLYKRAGVRHYR